MYAKILISIPLIALLAISCRLRKEDPALNQASARQSKEECLGGVNRCVEETNPKPYLCFMGSIQVRAPSRCQAERKIATAVCGSGDTTPITCVPDTSDGTCLEDFQAQCKTGSEKSVTCWADTYDGEAMDSARRPRTWSKQGECFAKAALKDNVCSNNLDPKKLGTITCVADFTDGACPAQLEECQLSSGANPTICKLTEIDGEKITPSFTSYEPSACEAKNSILRQVCDAASPEKPIIQPQKARAMMKCQENSELGFD